MKRRAAYWRAVALFALAILPLDAAPPRDAQQRLDSWHAGQPGGMALAWVDADGVALFSTGKFSEDDSRPITGDTQFSLGSVTKVFTTLLLAESEQRGVLKRADLAAKFLLPAEDSPQTKLRPITLLTLATHRAGLPTSPDNFVDVAAPTDDPFSTYGRPSLIAAFYHHGERAPVGRAMVYSNFGMAILGEAIATASGGNYADILNTIILHPLGMSSTGIGAPGGSKSSDLAPDHMGGVRKENWTLRAFAPAGAVRSTAHDLGIFLSAYIGKTRPALRRAMLETLKPLGIAEDFDAKVALGWFITEQGGRRIAWHPGATGGSRAFLGLDLDRQIGVAVLANSDKEVSPLAFGFLGANRPFGLVRPPTAVTKAPDYAGIYRNHGGPDITVSAQNGALFVRKPEWKFATPLREIAKDRFAVMLMPAEIAFERDPTGRVSAITTDLEGPSRRAIRE